MRLDQATYPVQAGRMHPLPDHSPSQELTSAILRERGGVRLLLRGELDMSGVLEAENAVRAAAELTDGRLVIDLTDLAFVDVFGARTLLPSLVVAGGVIVIVSAILAFLSGMNVKRRILLNLAILAAAVAISYLIGLVAQSVWGISV